MDGTTLALECLTPELTPEQRDLCNEPNELGQLILHGDADGAWQWIDHNIGKLPAPIIKSPHLSFAMRDRQINRKYHIICTHRHTAGIARSMLRYDDSRQIELTNRPYWHQYVEPPCWPAELNHRAFISAWAHFSSVIGRADEVWEYGLWSKWPKPQGMKFKDSTDSEAVFDREVTGGLDHTHLWFWQDANDALYDLWKARHA